MCSSYDSRSVIRLWKSNDHQPSVCSLGRGNVEMYHYVVPASAEKKIITQADAISELYAVFSELPVSDRKTEPVVGGAVTSFRFNLSDHTSYEIIYCAEAVKKGRLKLPAEQQDYFTSADIGGCWDGCAYEAVDTGESELPTYS